MSERIGFRYGALAGIAYALISLVAVWVGQSAGNLARGVTLADFSQFVDDPGTRVRFDTEAALTVYAVPLFLWLLGTLRAEVARAEPDNGRAATVVVSGGVVYVLLGIIVAAINEGIVSDYYENRELDASTGLFLLHASFHLSGFGNVGAAAMIGMTSLVARRTGFLPRWIAIGGLAWAALCLSLAFWPFRAPVPLVWILAVSGALYLRSRSSPDTSLPS